MVSGKLGGATPTFGSHFPATEPLHCPAHCPTAFPTRAPVQGPVLSPGLRARSAPTDHRPPPFRLPPAGPLHSSPSCLLPPRLVPFSPFHPPSPIHPATTHRQTRRLSWSSSPPRRAHSLSSAVSKSPQRRPRLGPVPLVLLLRLGVRLCSPFPGPGFASEFDGDDGPFHSLVGELPSGVVYAVVRLDASLAPSPVASTPSRQTRKALRHPTNTNANHAFLPSSLVQSPPHRRHHRRLRRPFVARASGSLEKSSTQHHHQTASPRRQPRHHGRTRSTGGV